MCGELSSAAAVPIAVTLSVTGGTALEGMDFTIPSPFLIFQAGNIVSCVEVMVVNDSLLENAETFTLSLSSSNPDVQTTGTATVAIPNRNSKSRSLLCFLINKSTHLFFFCHLAITISFVQPTDSVLEGNSLQICTQLSSEAAIPVTVPLVVGGGTAAQNTDFTLSSQSFTFLAGSVDSCVSITAVDDAILEEDEVVMLALLSSNAVLAGSGSTAITIIDQDSKLTESIIVLNFITLHYSLLCVSSDVIVRMQQGAYSAQEELERVQVCALLVGQIARTVPVSFATADGTAQGIYLYSMW